MTDRECVQFLQWSLPRMAMRWKGFRKVRRQVCRRLRNRLESLELASLEQYQKLLERNPAEWENLRPLLRVTISRFYRDRAVFNAIRWCVFSKLAKDAEREHRARIRCWSAGCSSGEEAYTLVLIWAMLYQNQFPTIELHITGTDLDAAVLDRARRAEYPRSSLKELPAPWIETAFEEAVGGSFRLKKEFRKHVNFQSQDILEQRPPNGFDLILCRYLIFTYYATVVQQEMLRQLHEAMRPGGVLVIGQTEKLPDNDLVTPLIPAARIFRTVSRKR